MIALLDACVIFPRVLRDTLLDAAYAGLYMPKWSGFILEELRRNLVAYRYVELERSHQLVDAMSTIFPEAMVEGYESLIQSMTNHPKDRHVLAAAVHSRADFLVTDNLSDFPSASLEPYQIAACSSDDFLGFLLDQTPNEMVQVILHQAAGYRRPPVSVTDLIERLAKFAPNFPARFASAQS